MLGVDNYQAARTSLPPLSSVHSPGEDIGYQAGAMLSRLLLRQEAGPPLAVPAVKIVARQSTGAGGDRTQSLVIRALSLIRQRRAKAWPWKKFWMI